MVNFRKEISLDSQTIAVLQIRAEKDGRKLKNYLEQILKEKANELALSAEYKALMDEALQNHENGNSNYKSWDLIKKEQGL
jgi:uncharacterized protein with von Willebrand factor type A (vWA) domain